MERRISELTNLIGAKFPDNGFKQITAADIRDYLWDAVDTLSSKMYIDPHHYGAKGDTVGAHDAVVSGGFNDQFSSASYSFTQDDVGKSLWFNATERTIQSVSSGVATFTPAHTNPINNNSDYWMMGTDDTVAIQAALDAARGMQGLDMAETAGGMNGMVMMGGTVRLRPGRSYLISNSQESYNAGKLSALKVWRRTSFIGGGLSWASSSLCLKPGSYGHMVANSDPTGGGNSYSDFITIGRMSLYGYKDWSPNALDGLHLRVAFNGYDKVDPFNRVFEVAVFRAKQHGFHFQGRGELIVDNCITENNSGYGFNFTGMADYKVTGCNSGGTSKTGFRITGSGAGHYVNCKSFYSGSNGGADIADCANFYLSADQMRNGMTYFTSCEAQESRGSSWVIDNSGLNMFTGCHGLDPGRAALSSSGTLPSIIAGFHIKGTGACQNTFNGCYVGPSVALWNMTNNWGNATDGVYIEGVDANGSGPQKNRGDIYSFVPTINPSGNVDPGIQYRAGYAAINGPGATNGRNVGLRIDGVNLASVVPWAVKTLTATPKDTAVLLSWAQGFDGGSAVTDYIIEYKEASSGSWLTFSDGTSTALTATVTGLVNGTSYNFRVTASNIKGNSPVSSTATATPYVSAPNQVTGVVATAAPDSVDLTWTAPFDNNNAITDYLVEYKASASPDWLTFTDGTSTATTVTVTGLTGATSYDFRISAINAIGTGAASATSTATPTVFTPLNYGVLAWYDPSDASTVHATGGLVDTLDDKSGNAYHATQTGAARPTTGTRTINGLNGLDCAGTQNLALPSALYTAANANNTVFVVMQSDTAVGGIKNVFASNSNLWSLGINPGSSQVVARNHTSTTVTGVLTSPSYLTQHILMSKRTAAKLDVKYDTQAASHNSGCDTVTITSLNIGGTTDGIFTEIQIFPTALTATQETIVRNYLKTKWATP